ncbi:MAG: hypothetical protein A2521_00950 [Deltaproteobacteria bacterium RIFOXYD12_FULL_57_12]|nr:MAG: hypothetical protein A2521_00950 [Deltaproteobacteria bacterium RIFOXYD12_FULL_57_12]
METLQSFLTLLIPLLIIMDPFGNLPLFLLFTAQNSEAEQRRMAAVAAGAAGLILLFFALSGDVILRFFNISLPAFQLAGGFIFFIYALQMLQILPVGLKSTTEEEQEGVAKENIALVPLATPMLAGPGAITAVLVWKQQPASAGIAELVLAILLSCLASYAVFFLGERISRLLGVSGIKVITRLMGLLLAVIAVQFMVNGLKQIW